MNKRILKSVVFIIVFFAIITVYAQNPPSPNRPPPPPGVPIDGGVLALLSVAVGYAVNKLRIKK